MPDRSLAGMKKPATALKISRRGFLRIVAGIGIAGLTSKLALDSIHSSETIQETRMLMGTLVNLTLIAPDRCAAIAGQQAVIACLDRMSELESVFSRFKIDSQVSRLNRVGALDRPHPALLYLIELSQYVSQISNGAFDITIQPLLALYQQYQIQNLGIPPAAEIEAARRKVNYRNLEVTSTRIAFAESGMAITLDGIAKGYIVDEGVAVLRLSGFNDVLVEAGGDLIASGCSDLESSWHIGIQSPRPGHDRLIAHFDVSDLAMATSGDYMQPFTEDYSQHHILNPSTGFSSPNLASATVIAPRLAIADALATALMVMDPEAGKRLVRDLGFRAEFINKNMVRI